MSRFSLTPLMRPTSLQPSLTGPRDAVRTSGNRPTIEDARATQPFPTPAAAPTTNHLESTMSTQQRVIEALTKKSPQTRAQLAAMTGMATAQLSNALFNARNTKKITATGKGADREYSLAGSAPKAKATKPAKAAKRTYTKRKPAPESFADGVKARERELEQQSRSNGTDLHTKALLDLSGATHPIGNLKVSNAREVTDFNLFITPAAHFAAHEASALPCRAISKADGGAIVLRGNTLTAELSAEELNVIHQLRALA